MRSIVVTLLPVLLLLPVGIVRGAANFEVCDSWGAVTGSCELPTSTGTIRDGGVDVEAHSGSGNSGNGSAGSDAGGGEGPQSPVIVPVVGEDGVPVNLRELTGDADAGAINCGAVVICNPVDPFPTTVSLADIASFRPSTPSQGMEPSGWSVVGLPSNFFAAASVEVLSGRVLGFDALVRFTPIAYHWDYGDGATRSSSTGGATWAALGLPEFSETATSHAYAASGDRTVQLSVEYAAEYSFAGRAYTAIAGTLSVPAPALSTRAGTADTVLVGRDCIGAPSGPGC